MTRKSNQRVERYYFEMFRRDFALPEGKIVYGDKPDIIVHGERRIGIEITNFFLVDGELSESEQVQGKARQKVVSEAQQIYLASGGRRIELSFGFEKTHSIRNQGELAKKIAKLPERIDRLETGAISQELFKDIPELSFVFLNAREYEDARWRVVQCHSVPVMSMKQLQAIVGKKEAQSQQYEHCDAYWLLVVVDFMNRAQDQEIRIDGSEKIHSGVFEKVVVYKTLFGHVFHAK